MCRSRERKFSRTWRELGGETPWGVAWRGLGGRRPLLAYSSTPSTHPAHPAPRCSLLSVATWCLSCPSPPLHTSPLQVCCVLLPHSRPIALVATPAIRSFAAAPPTSTVDHRHPACTIKPPPTATTLQTPLPPAACCHTASILFQTARLDQTRPFKAPARPHNSSTFPRFVPRLLPLHLRFTPRVTHLLTLHPVSMISH